MHARKLRSLCLAGVLAIAVVGLSALGLAHRAGAQQGTPTVPTSEQPSVVSVNGHGSVMIAPDAASISVGVNITNKSLSEAQAQATSSMTAVIEALKAAGIAEADIQTTSYSVTVHQEYDASGYPARVSGYQVNNQVTVTVREIEKLGEILDQVVKAGANSIYGVSFVVTDTSDAAAQARTAAIADARAKAEQIAAATGMQLGRVLSVTETYSPPPMPYAYGGKDMALAESAVPIQTGSNTVTVDVQMTFELVG